MSISKPVLTCILQYLFPRLVCFFACWLYSLTTSQTFPMGCFTIILSSTCLFKPNATSSFPVTLLPSLLPNNLFCQQYLHLLQHSSSKPQLFSSAIFLEIWSQSTALIYSNIIFRANWCQTMLQVLSFLKDTFPLCPFLPTSAFIHSRYSYLIYSIIVKALYQASMILILLVIHSYLQIKFNVSLSCKPCIKIAWCLTASLSRLYVL